MKLRHASMLLAFFGLAACVACSDSSAEDDATDASVGDSSAGGSAGLSSGGGGTGGAGTAGVGGSSGSSAAGGAAGASGSGGAPTDAGSDGPADAGAVEVTLLSQPGAVFTPSSAEPVKKLVFGAAGTTYGSVRVELDVLVGDYQPEMPDPGNPDRTEHILFGLFRDKQPQSYQRYLMGAAAVTFATKAPHFRMFGRKAIAQGYTSYTSWSSTYAWQKGGLYHLDCLLDGVSHAQKCELYLSGKLEKALAGDVAYLDPKSHLNSGFYLELGTPSPADIEASPLGWQYSNLEVTATLLP